MRVREARGTRRLVAALALLAVAGTCEPRKPAAVSFEYAERLEKEGKPVASALEYDRLAGAIAEREDLEAGLGLARIHRRLFENGAWRTPEVQAKARFVGDALQSPGGSALLVRACEFYLRILSEPGGGDARIEAAAFLSETMERKAREPGTRFRSLGDGAIHRVLLLECASMFEHRLLALAKDASRTRLAGLFRDVASEYRALSSHPRVRPAIAERWKERADAYSDLGMAAERDKELPSLPDEFARVGHSGPDGQLEEVTNWSDRGVQEITQRGDAREAERCFRTAMRYLNFACETLAFPTMRQADSLSAGAGIEKSWSSLCFPER